MSTSTYGNNGDRAIEWLFSAMMVAWGVYLMLPLNTFAAPQYALLAALAEEKVWGIWSVSIGVMRMVALYINGAVRQTPIVRMGGALFGVVWWAVLTWLFLTAPSGVTPAGVVWYPIFALAEMYSVLRSAGDAWISGAFRREPKG